MANRFWVNGNGKWSDIAHWSNVSGGVGGSSIPTASDNVYFDINSFTENNQKVNLDIVASCKDIDWTGAGYNPTMLGHSALYVHGVAKFVNSMTNSFDGYIFMINSSEFYGGGLSFNMVHFKNNGIFSIEDGNNTFKALKLDSGSSLVLKSGTVQNIKQLTARGTLFNKINISSSIEGSTATINCDSYMLNIYYCNIKDVTGTGGASFQALRCVDNGNNSGWTFLDNSSIGQFAPATQQIAGLMQPSDKTKLDGVSVSADDVGASLVNGNIKINGTETNVYTHPESHNASMIIEDATHRFVTDVEKNSWNNGTGASIDAYTKAEVDSKVTVINSDIDAINTSLLSIYTKTEVDTKISDLVDSSPEALNTLNELASALGNDANFSTTVLNNIGLKLNSADYTKESILTKLDTLTEQEALLLIPLATQLLNGLMSKVDKSKLDGISVGANKVEDSLVNGNILIDGTESIVYTHPNNHSASMITEDSTHRFTTDVEKSTWNDKVDASYVSTAISTKLDISSYTAVDVLAKLLGVDGASSGLDADLLDGIHASALEKISNKGVANGYASLDSNTKVPASQIPDISKLTSNDYQITSGTQSFEVQMV